MMNEARPHCGDPRIWFGFWTYEVFGEPIRHYGNILMNRFIPIFDDLEGEEQRAVDAFLNSGRQGEDDYDRACQEAFEHGQNQVLQFIELRSAFLAAGVAGLFHLFEKQLYRHLNNELRDNLTLPIESWKDATDLIHFLDQPATADGRSALHMAFDDSDLKELRLVANAVKHGGGRSYKELKAMGAAVVDIARTENDWTVGRFSILNAPLVIQSEDVRQYEAAILRFWALKGSFWRKLDDTSSARS